MYCTKCSAQNSDEAVYCQKCGSLLEAEEETRVVIAPKKIESSAGDADDDEAHIFSIHPTLMFVKIGYGLAVLGAFLLVILLNLFGNLIGVSIPYWLSIP